MRISEEKRRELHDAIRHELVVIRLEVQECKRFDCMSGATAERLDKMLFEAETSIWAKQREVLGIKD